VTRSSNSICGTINGTVAVRALPDSGRPSDGVTEATLQEGQLVGIEGLERMLLAAEPGRSRVEQIHQRIAAAAEGAALEDDFSLVEFGFA